MFGGSSLFKILSCLHRTLGTISATCQFCGEYHHTEDEEKQASSQLQRISYIIELTQPWNYFSKMNSYFLKAIFGCSFCFLKQEAFWYILTYMWKDLPTSDHFTIIYKADSWSLKAHQQGLPQRKFYIQWCAGKCLPDSLEKGEAIVVFASLRDLSAPTTDHTWSFSITTMFKKQVTKLTI